MEAGLTRNAIIEQLTRSTHGNLKDYLDVARRAAKEEPEFTAHLISWNRGHGQIRDAKVALPIATLSVPEFDPPAREGDLGALAENSLAHVASLDAKNLLRAVRFGLDTKTPGRRMAIRRTVEEYLRVRESRPQWFDRVAVQHRGSLKELYAICHVKPGERARDVLFDEKYPTGSVFEAIRHLRKMTPEAIHATIKARGIPFLIAVGAVGDRMDEPDVAIALINAASPAEVVNNAAMFERRAKNVPAVRGALEEAFRNLGAPKKGRGVATLKATVAADAVEDEALAEKLKGVQEKQLAATVSVLEADVLICADRSPSMRPAVEFTRQLAAVLAKVAKPGRKVHVVFFDGNFYRYVDATGKALDAITKETANVDAGGSATSIGSALDYALQTRLPFDVIAVVSDGGENRAPYFHEVYARATKALDGKIPPVYFYKLKGESDDVFSRFMETASIPMEVFDLRKGFDYYSLPNIVSTMRASRYSLVEAIMGTPLLKLADVLKA